MEYLAVLLPSAGVGTLFYFVMRALFNSDRSEREALARAEAEARQKQDKEATTPDPMHRGEPKS